MKRDGKTKLKIAVVLFSALLLSSICQSVTSNRTSFFKAQSQKTLVSIIPKYILTGIETFTMNVTVKEVTDLYAWQTKILFDPEILNATGAWYPSNYVFSGKPRVEPNPVINNTLGYVLCGASLWMKEVTFNGSGILCQIGFKVKKPNLSYLSFSRPLEGEGSKTFLLDSNLNFITIEVAEGLVNVDSLPTIASSFRYPLDGLWTISQRFGTYDYDWNGYHLGEDVLRSFEAPVYAPADGVVTHNAKRTGYGYVVIIEHELMDRTFVCSVLGHLREKDRAQVGSIVTKGQIIGYLSSISEENGGFIHIHFGTREGHYSEELDFDGKWRYRGYGSADIVDYWYPPSDFINYYNIQKTSTLPIEEGLRVTIAADKTCYQLNETVHFNVTVTNPTNETGINVIAHNSSLTIDTPAEIELENPQTFHHLGNLNPGESKTLSFTALAKEVGELLKMSARAAGEDIQLGLSMLGASLKQFSIRSTVPTEWSFAIITDLHFGRSGSQTEVKGRLETAIRAINNVLKDGYDIKFVLVLGDITDGGGVNDFFEAREILNRLNDPNQDGDTGDGIPYVPLIGNHDVKSDREWCFDYAFWGASNWNNKELIDARLTGFERQDRDELYYENYYFSYESLNFICLDFAARRGAEGGALAWYPDKTRQYLQSCFEENHGENFAVASHFPIYAGGGFMDQNAFIADLIASGCDVVNFAGHTHANRDQMQEHLYAVVETESASQVECPGATYTGETIRIVKVTNGEIDDYSTRKNPEAVLEEYRIFWEHVAFFTVEGFGSYLEPNRPAIFTAYYPMHHGFETSFQWTFDDGSSGSGFTASHNYLQEGDYTVTLDVIRRNLITNETITETIRRSLCVRTKHTISLLPANSYATSFPSVVDLTEVPTNMHCQVVIGKNSTGGRNPVVAFGLHFENADANIDLSNIILDTDTTTKKSIVFSSSWPIEADCGKWLFVPSSGAGSVYICFNATKLEDVRLENADLIINIGETINNITVTTTYCNGKEYYLVYGNIANFGGGEIFHNIATANITQSKTIIGQGFNLPINVTIQNTGTFPETFDVTVYANTTVIGTQTVNNIIHETSTVITFTWNTTGFVKGNYTVWAYAEPVNGETYTLDNTLTGGSVFVGIVGDVNGNRKVDLDDVLAVAIAYGSFVGAPRYKPNLDVDGNGKIDLADYLWVAINYGKVDP